MKDPDRPRHVTLKDIAQELGVSLGTVSMAMRDDPRITEGRRQQVKETARKMGYRPNAMATALARFKKQSQSKPVQAALAWINAWPDPKKMRTYREFDLYWKGAVKAAEKFGFRLEEFAVSEMPLSRMQKVFRARNIRGIIIAPTYEQSAGVDWGSLDWDKFSVVRLGRREAPPEVHFVTSAQAANAMIAFDKMRERGYKRIAYAGEWARRVMFGAGFYWAQRGFPKEVHLPAFLLSPGMLPQKPFEAWLRKTKPDAITLDDPRVPLMLKNAGYRVPEDIGFATMAAGHLPFEAGIDQNPEEIGRVAVLIVISLMQDNSLGEPPILREILVRGKWVDGPSLPPRT